MDGIKFKKTPEDFVEKLKENRRIRTQFVVMSKEIKESKNGNQYVEVHLKDKTGAIVGRIFSDKIFETLDSIQVGKVHRIIGNLNEFPVGSGYFSIMMNRIQEVPENEFDREDFVITSELDQEAGILYIQSIIKTLDDKDIKSLLRGFFEDKEFMKTFSEAPAAVVHHHNYEGGLMEHTYEVTETCDLLSSQMPQLNRDLLIAGGLLHDIGKVKAYTWDFMNIKMTDEGKLMDHVLLGSMMINDMIRKKKLMGYDWKNLFHLIVTHNGERKNGWGSLVDPQLPEAVALHHADNMNARMKTAVQEQK